MERKKYITEDTKINIDEEAFKVKAEELLTELFVDFVNTKHNASVVEVKN